MYHSRVICPRECSGSRDHFWTTEHHPMLRCVAKLRLIFHLSAHRNLLISPWVRYGFNIKFYVVYTDQELPIQEQCCNRSLLVGKLLATRYRSYLNVIVSLY